MTVTPFPEPDKTDEFLTTKDLCDRWNCHHATVYRVSASDLPYTKPTGRRLYKLSDVLEYEAERTVAA